jgi:hypothetical protein
VLLCKLDQQLVLERERKRWMCVCVCVSQRAAAGHTYLLSSPLSIILMHSAPGDLHLVGEGLPLIRAAQQLTVAGYSVHRPTVAHQIFSLKINS